MTLGKTVSRPAVRSDTASPNGETPVPRPPAGNRRWWFRILAVLFPFLLLGLVEAGLRLADYGYPTAFFLKASQDNRSVLVENPKFGWRFFPPAVARTPQPLVLAPAKPAGTTRIFVFGESAAMGDPEPAHGFSRQLERLLAARYPGQTFEVVNTAMTAINSHVIREIARDCAPRAGDFWVIYMGNNEVVGPFGAGTVFGRQAPALGVVRAGLWLKSTRLGQWLATLPAHSAGPQEWEGMEMFLHNQVRRDAPGLRVVRENFARNLAAIIELGRRSGATVLLATVPVNLKDSPPFASQHHPGLSAAQQDEWDKHFARGREAQAAGQYAEALVDYQAAGQIDAEFAELAYRRAMCERALGQAGAAAADYKLACDLDTLRFRADTEINQTIRRAAVEHGITLVDAEGACAGRSPGGVPGESLFYDHVHLNFPGNYLVAGLFATEIGKHLNERGAPAGPGWLAESDVARELAFTDFDRRRIAEEMQLRLRQAPFATQLNLKTRDEQWQALLNQTDAPPARLRAEYQTALARAPEDWVLHDHFGRALEAAGDDPAAVRQWQEVARLVPQEPDAWFHLGNLAYNTGALAQAREDYLAALQRKPDLLEARNGLGLTLAALGDAEGAIREFQAVLHRSPAFSAARVNLAVVLAGRGEVPAAIAEYRTALELDTNNVPARINLARLLAGQGQPEQAIGLFQAALALRPDEPVANFDLANTLVAQDRHDEARPYFRAAIRAKPDFAEAHFNLAMEAARAGDFTESAAEFAEAVRLQPDSAEARFNYGVALAKNRRYADAATQFQETLQRQPDNAAAKAALERALRLAQGQATGR